MENVFSLSTLVSDLLGPFGSYELFGNTGPDYVIAAAVFVVAAAVFAVLQKVIIARLRAFSKKTKTDLDDTLIAIVSGVRPAFYFFVAFYIGLRFLSLPSLAMQILTGMLLVWVAVQVVFALQKLIDYALERKARREENESAIAAFTYFGNIAKWLLWVFAALAVLANFGVNISSVLAGIGIAGIAIGLALQNILADLFSSFAIYFDKPFQMGDFIIVGEHMGTVEHIGIKTTRIRALQGEEIVISNQELTSARVQNFRKLEERRVAFTVGVLYETSIEKVKKIPGIIKTILENTSKVRTDRVHFSALGDSALVFEIVYYVLSDEYVDKMDAQQQINYALVEEFEKESIEFAYPTQMLHIKK